jgi:hypothetical protein
MPKNNSHDVSEKTRNFFNAIPSFATKAGQGLATLRKTARLPNKSIEKHNKNFWHMSCCSQQERGSKHESGDNAGTPQIAVRETKSQQRARQDD